jgi:hypothetical protein
MQKQIDMMSQIL